MKPQLAILFRMDARSFEDVLRAYRGDGETLPLS